VHSPAALTVGGLVFAGIIGGAVIVENVFRPCRVGTGARPGRALQGLSRDPGIVLVLGIPLFFVNTVTTSHSLVDPRSLTKQS